MLEERAAILFHNGQENFQDRFKVRPGGGGLIRCPGTAHDIANLLELCFEIPAVEALAAGREARTL